MYVVGLCLGVLAGFTEPFLDVDLSLKPSLFLVVASALVTTAILHEGVHGAVSLLLGYRPIFGFKPPLIYVTFAGKVPRGRFMLMALSPFVILNLLFGVLYANGLVKLFSDFGLIINTIGSVGDMWIALKLVGIPKGASIQDTRTGFEAWVN